MEWMNRGGQQGHPAQPQAAGAASPQSKRGRALSGPMQWGAVVLLFAVTALVLSIIAFLTVTNNSGGGDSKVVDSKNMQAVFLNGGQVYFGNIKSLNDKSLRMDNIYYLRVNQQVQPNSNTSTNNNDISLVKLGCELHGPQDSMVINQSQVIFWENLKSDGQVAQAVKKYKEQNPNGQQCNTNSNTTNTNTNTNNNATTPTTRNP